MKKLASLITIAVAAFASSCSEADSVVAGDTNPDVNSGADIRVSPINMDESTRVSIVFNPNSGGFTFGWTADDKVGMFCTSNDAAHADAMQLNINAQTIKDNDGAGQYAHFDFANSAFSYTTGSGYTFYRPFVSGDVYNAIPMNMEGQVQKAKADITAAMSQATTSDYLATEKAAMAHLCDLDFMISSQIFPEEGVTSPAFNMKHVPCFVRLYFTAPQMKFTPNRVDVVADKEVFATQGKLNLTPGAELIKNTKMSNALTLGLSGIETSYTAGKRDHYIAAYLAVLPVDLSTKLEASDKIYLYLTGTDESGVQYCYRSKSDSGLVHANLPSNYLYQWTTATQEIDDPIEIVEISVQEWREAVGVEIGHDVTKDW